MEMTQMNTRIPVQLKAQGDEVLARSGKTASDVMRAIWQYMADHQRLPACLLESDLQDAQLIEQRMRRVAEGGDLVASFRRERGLPASPDARDYKLLREEMYESMLAEYEALNA